MSSYWAGNEGTGLVLNEKEFEQFLENYNKENPHKEKVTQESIMESGLEDVEFTASVAMGQEGDVPTFSLSILSDDCYEGVAFWPFFRPDGRMNVCEQKEDGSFEDAVSKRCMETEGTVFVLFSKRSFTSPKVFTRPAYANYEEFKQEFVLQVGGYLPEDFDWDAHLGIISYACFA